MKSCITILLLCGCIIANGQADRPAQQVTIETKIVTANDDFTKELGIEWGLGPSISHFTNVDNPNQINVTGLTAFAGVDWYVNPILGVFGHGNISMFGDGNEYFDGWFKQRYTAVGVDAGIKLHLIPRVSKVNVFVMLEVVASGVVGGVTISKQNDEKDKTHFDLSDQNKGFVAAGGGVGVTIRNDVMDLSIQTVVLGGLNQVFNDNNDVTPRSVPLLIQIPVIGRFFKKKDEKRPETLIFITPRILEESED